ncbi:monocarboxylate transporter 10-like [Mercenaria mercenaria]|uniref:monocarboxylate transporter 10-like n=1 Tax=Mercenaria mercenaria TaxID=6596 RepID=UPI00234F4CBA|nr:monocarboxylate transporter 10-like [Mercenaria mercenaria]
MILLPLLQNKVWILFMSAILGSTYCVTGGYTPDVILKLVGLENISDGLGFGQVAKALGSTIAGPLAGLLFQWSRPYETSFYVGGSVFIGSCLLMIPIITSLRRQRTYRQKTAHNTVKHVIPGTDESAEIQLHQL